MVESLHGEELAVDGVVRLIQHRAHRRHLWVCEHGIPACFLFLKPVLHAFTVLLAHGGGEVIDKATETLAQCRHPQAVAPSAPVSSPLNVDRSPWRTEAETPIQLFREFVERMAQAQAQASPRKQRAHTLRGAVEAIGEGAPHLYDGSR